MKTNIERLLTTEEASEVLGLSRVTMWRMRKEGTGPAYVKMNRFIRYRPQDLRDWINSKKEQGHD